jgi:hypothetical protein
MVIPQWWRRGLRSGFLWFARRAFRRIVAHRFVHGNALCEACCQTTPPSAQTMYLIVIAWTYVTLMMAVAEATSANGTVLGAIITFALYGALPMGILVYILGTPSRKRAIKAREAAEQAAYDAQQAAAASAAPDTGSEAPAAAPGQAVAPVREKP